MEQKLIYFLKILNNCVLVYTVFTSILLVYLSPSIILFLHGFFLLLFVILSELIQIYIKKLIPYSLLHISFFICIFFIIPNLSYKVPLLCFLFFLTIFSYYGRIKEIQFFYPDWKELLLYIFLYLSGCYLKSSALCSLALVAEIFSCFLSITYRNMYNLITFFDFSKDTSDIPYSKIRHTNLLLLFLTLIIGFFSIFLTFLFQKKNALLSYFKTGLLLLLQFIIKAITKLFSSPRESVKQNTPSPVMLSPALNDVQSSPFFNFISNVLTILLFLFCMCFLFFILYKLIEHFVSVFQSAKLPSQILSPKECDIRERTIKQSQKTSSKKVFRFSNKTLLRKAYIRFILHFPNNKKIHPSDSPYEIENLVISERNSDLENMHIIYEKARYSNNPCTNKDLKKFHHYMISFFHK